MTSLQKKTAYYHLPGLFEFYELYRMFLPLFREHREYFYDWCEIGSIYGAPADCYRFSEAMKNPGFIGIDAIQNIYLPMEFSNFKLEGRSLGSALILEFLLYYMTRPEYQLHVREAIYLDNTLDLF